MELKKEVIQLFEDRIIIRQLDAEKRSPGGIIIPDIAKEKPTKGIVVDVGPEVENLTPGMTVIYGKYAGIELELNGQEDLWVMREKDIIGIVKSLETLPDHYIKS